MIVDLRQINTYYLNPDSFSDRRNRMEDLLSSLKMNYERHIGVTNLSPRPNNYSFGSIQMIEKAISRDKYPFLLLDDDVDLIVDLPQSITVPEECDIVYLGASKYECYGKKPEMKLQDYNEDYYRIFYSLSSHALLINTKSAAAKTIEVLKKSLEHNEYSDVYMALESRDSVFLTPKNGPYFYQTEAHTKEVTKFLWKDLCKLYL